MFILYSKEVNKFGNELTKILSGKKYKQNYLHENSSAEVIKKKRTLGKGGVNGERIISFEGVVSKLFSWYQLMLDNLPQDKNRPTTRTAPGQNKLRSNGYQDISAKVN